MKTSCPHCGQHYELDDSAVGSIATCESCWKDFTIGEAPPPPKPEVRELPRPVILPRPPATRCPFCGGEIAPGVKKCRHCGEWFNRAEEAKNPVVFVILALSLGMLGVHNFYSGARNRGFVKLTLMLGIPQLLIILSLVLGLIFASVKIVFPFVPIISGIGWMMAFAVVTVLNIREMINCHAECARRAVDKKRLAVYILAALTGGIWGLHDFYMERSKRGLVRLVLATAGYMIVSVLGMVLSAALETQVIGSILIGSFCIFMLAWALVDVLNYPRELNEA